VFTARYALSPYIKQIRFVFKGLNDTPDWTPSHLAWHCDPVNLQLLAAKCYKREIWGSDSGFDEHSSHLGRYGHVDSSYHVSEERAGSIFSVSSQTLKVEVLRSSEKSVTIYQWTRCNISEDFIFKVLKTGWNKICANFIITYQEWSHLVITEIVGCLFVE
jgi:hypothetical protein